VVLSLTLVIVTWRQYRNVNNPINIVRFCSKLFAYCVLSLSVTPYFCSAYGYNKDSEDTRRQGITFHKLVYIFWHLQAGAGVSGLTRGLVTLAPRWIQEPSVVTDRDRRPPRGPFGSALLLCVSRECTAGRSPWGKQIQGTWSSVRGSGQLGYIPQFRHPLFRHPLSLTLTLTVLFQ